MRLSQQIVALALIPTLFLAAPAFAQQARIADAAVLQQALAAQSATEDAQRDTVRRVLDRADVRALAGRLGLNVADATTAVATLSGTDLAAAAQHAQGMEQALAGGQNTIVISVTTLLLVLLIVILLAD